MRRAMLTALFLGLAVRAHGSEVIPPRIAITWLIQAVQAGRANSVAYHFIFDENKHEDLTPLSKDEQLALLKPLPINKLEFDKDADAADEGERFVVKLLAPDKLEFEMECVELDDVLGPPWKYAVIAVRRPAQQPASGDRLKAPPEE